MVLLLFSHRAVVRFAIFRRSEARILCNGGATAFDPLLLYSQRGAGRNNEARAKEVFEAFAAFREQHCFPPIPAGRQGSNNPPAMDVDANDPVTADGQSSGKKALWWEGPPAPAHPSPPAANLAALKDLEQRAAAAQAAAARLLVGAEVLHILRPLVYVLALRRWGRRSWKPWLLSLVVELASARLTSSGAVASRRAAAEASRDPAVVSTSLAPLYAMQGVAWRRDEADELTRRKLLLLYYLLRDPFFSRFTGPAVERWQGRLGRVPLVGWITDKAAELLLGVQKYYTYTAAS